MDKHTNWVLEQRIKRTIDALEKNNINGYYLESREEIIETIKDIAEEGSVVASGGSMTLFELGVIDHLRTDRYKFLDRYKEGLSGEDIRKIYVDAFDADVYFTSTNAITEDGELYNVDGNGNRVAAMIYGPKKVIVVVGVNKIVKNLDEAIKRNRNIAAPANAKRLDRQTPCAKVGYCMDCKSPEKICRAYTVIKSQGVKDRMHVLFINEEAGY